MRKLRRNKFRKIYGNRRMAKAWRKSQIKRLGVVAWLNQYNRCAATSNGKLNSASMSNS